MPQAPPIIRTKLHPPRVVTQVVPRPRLFRLLETGSELPVTLVSAPAGYGKSTLVASWLASTATACTWLSLDEGDSDLSTFLQYVLAALETVVPQACPEVREVLRMGELPPVTTIAAVLANDLETLPADVVLVLDDYHWIHEPAVHDLVSSLLRHPPPRFHLVVVTRADPPLPLTTFLARGQAQVIRVADLQFNDEETDNFLRAALERDLDAKTVHELAATTEGWAVGLQLAALTLRQREDVEGFLVGMRGGLAQAEHYLVAEVLDRLPQRQRRHLLHAAVLERFCAPLCEAVFPSSGEDEGELSGDEFLDWLRRSNLFVNSLDEQERWFRFHHLFRELLLHQLASRFSDQEIIETRQRAAGWLEENGYLEEALSHLLAAKAFGRALALVKRHRRELMNREEWARLERWLDRLPSEVVERDVELLLQRAWICENQFRYPEMIALLRQIETLMTGRAAGGVPIELLGELAALESARHYFESDAAGAEAMARRALEELPAERRSERGFALVVLAFALQMSGRIEEAKAIGLDALEGLEERGTSFHGRILVGLCFVFGMEGEPVMVERFAQELLALGEEFHLPESTSFARYFLATAAWDQNRLETAEAHLVPLLEDRFPANLSNLSHGGLLLALLRSSRGEDDAARETLRALAARAVELRHPELLSLVEAFEAELALRQHRPQVALLWARKLEPGLEGPQWRCFLPALTWVRAMLESDEASERARATEVLTSLGDHLAALHQRRFLADVHALRAVVAHRAGDEPAALSALREALEIARPRGLVRPFLDLGSEMAELLRLANLEIGTEGLVEIGDKGTAPRSEGEPAAVPSFESLARPGDPDALTDRELEVLGLLAERYSNKEIAARLHVTSATVKRHTVNIYQKLGVHGRREAVAKARALARPRESRQLD